MGRITGARAVQDVRFGRDGQVAFTDWQRFTVYDEPEDTATDSRPAHRDPAASTSRHLLRDPLPPRVEARSDSGLSHDLQARNGESSAATTGTHADTHPTHDTAAADGTPFEVNSRGDQGGGAPDDAAGVHRWAGGLSDADEIVTLNLPLLGVLAAIDKRAGPFRHLAALAVRRFFFAQRGSDRYSGLFTSRHAPSLNRITCRCDASIVSGVVSGIP